MFPSPEKRHFYCKCAASRTPAATGRLVLAAVGLLFSDWPTALPVGRPLRLRALQWSSMEQRVRSAVKVLYWKFPHHLESHFSSLLSIFYRSQIHQYLQYPFLSFFSVPWIIFHWAWCWRKNKMIEDTLYQLWNMYEDHLPLPSNNFYCSSSHSMAVNITFCTRVLFMTGFVSLWLLNLFDS
jgi:hypothetical protein